MYEEKINSRGKKVVPSIDYVALRDCISVSMYCESTIAKVPRFIASSGISNLGLVFSYSQFICCFNYIHQAADRWGPRLELMQQR